jgi:hypothetical protein
MTETVTRRHCRSQPAEGPQSPPSRDRQAGDPHRFGLQGADGEVFRNRNDDQMHGQETSAPAMGPGHRPSSRQMRTFSSVRRRTPQATRHDQPRIGRS